MAKTPFKMKGFSGFGNSPLKDKKSDEAFITSAKRQKRNAIARLIKKAKSEGLSGQAAIDAANTEYKRNI